MYSHKLPVFCLILKKISFYRQAFSKNSQNKNWHENASSGSLDGHADSWQADTTKRQSLVAALETRLERMLF